MLTRCTILQLEPNIGEGFRRATNIWKSLWRDGSNCENTNFVDGKCAIGYGPPGCWKQVFKKGVNRKDVNGTIVWQPTMKSGEYAEPYRFKPFGSTEVVDSTGKLTPCTKELCPKGELIPAKGHHGDNDRASILPESPSKGKLINRAPFYWSGGLGTLIRESSTKEKKDLMWDFFVYSNSPDTAVYDVANYGGWLDSWRYSQLSPGDNFIAAGWSPDSYQEHANIMNWALSNEANGAFNLRLPGAKQYTHEVLGTLMGQFINEEITEDDLVAKVAAGWEEISQQRGKLDQLETYRASLSLDKHSEVELCRLHRKLMDERDPSICQKYDPTSSDTKLIAILVPITLFAIAIVIFVHLDRKRRKADCVWQIKPQELKFAEPPEVLGRGTFGLVILGEYRGTNVAVKRVLPPKKAASILGSKDSYTVAFDVEAPHETGTPKASENKAPDIFNDPDGSKVFSSGNYSQSVTASAIINKKSERRGGLFNKSKSRDDYGKLKADFIVEMRYLAKLRHP